MITKTRATLEDLYAAPGKAELVKGELVLMSPTGGIPSAEYLALRVMKFSSVFAPVSQ